MGVTSSDPGGTEAGAARHCDQCGRAVRETVHDRTSFVVDGFALHTGETEPATVRRGDSDQVAITYQRLVRPVLLITCADCYADPACRRRHQTWIYPSA